MKRIALLVVLVALAAACETKTDEARSYPPQRDAGASVDLAGLEVHRPADAGVNVAD